MQCAESPRLALTLQRSPGIDDHDSLGVVEAFSHGPAAELFAPSGVLVDVRDASYGLEALCGDEALLGLLLLLDFLELDLFRGISAHDAVPRDNATAPQPLPHLPAQSARYS